MSTRANRMKAACWLAALAIIVVATPHIAACQEIFIKTDTQQGAGTLRARGQVCYAVTANHVVADPGNIEVIDSTDTTYAAQVSQRFAQDIAVLQVLGAKRDLCPGGIWDSSASTIDFRLKSNRNAEGKLVRILENGTVSQMTVSIKAYDAQYVDVTPVKSDDSLTKGWSGSSLYVDNAVIGLLTTVNANNLGQAYRLDYIDQLVGGFFKPGQLPDPFFDQVQSADFCNSLRSILKAAQSHNRLNSIKGERDLYHIYQKFDTFQSTIALPGTKGMGWLTVHQDENYHDEKYPEELEYDFGDARNDKDRFDILQRSVRQCLPADWTVAHFENGSGFAEMLQAKHKKSGLTLELTRASYGTIMLALKTKDY